ncbi:hypothetical protein [Sphingobacterium siyangense]|uniref:hypothetical protein n=1 Tax=Sphingobacterium siyangense TaxID=459529 RepID=UPI003DA4F170
MAQTLKITTPEALDASANFLKLNEIRLPITTVVDGSVVRLGVEVGLGKSVTFGIVGNTTAQFCSADGLTLLGKTVSYGEGVRSVYFKTNGTFEISINSKHNIKSWGADGFLTTPNSSVAGATTSVDLKSLKFSPYSQLSGYRIFKGDLKSLNKTALTLLDISTDTTSANQVSGELTSSVFNPSLLANLLASGNKNITGDVSTLTLSNLLRFSVGSTMLSGALPALNAGLVSLDISNTNISMALSVLNGKNLSGTFNLAGSLATGSIENIGSINKSEIHGLNGLTISGDVSKLHDSCYYVANSNGTEFKNRKADLSTTFWTNKKSTRQYIIALERVRLATGVDQYLIDMAALELAPTSVNGSAYLRTISIVGTRTSASDAAVATLAGKGVTVAMLSSN